MEELKKIPIKNCIERKLLNNGSWGIIGCNYEGLFDIYENGDVFSYTSNRFLKPRIQERYGYTTVYLYNKEEGYGFWWQVSRLVAIHFIGDPPTYKHEADHKDRNPMNNHYTNLQWITHQENIQKSYSYDERKAYWKGKHKPPFSLEHRLKMANAAYKPVGIFVKGKLFEEFPSVEKLLEYLGWYRRKFNRIMNNGGTFKDMEMRFL